MKIIKVGYIVSYDYSMLLTSIKQLYKHVDKIVVAIDIDRKTWSGNTFKIPESFFDEVKTFDTRNIIEFYFDNFYIPSLRPIECETRERNLVLEKLGKGWKIQLDVDEYIYDFEVVSKYLKRYWYLTFFPKWTPLVFKGKLITLFKKVDRGFLYIDNDERFPFITNQTFNTYARKNNIIRNHYTNISVIHQSWAREEIEIIMKVKNWGHRDDFDTNEYIEFWKRLNKDNYLSVKNFHPLIPVLWEKLEYMEANSINDFIEKYSYLNEQKLFPVLIKNQIKALKNKLIK
ncbi:MAG: hypothetical protein RLZZ540_315 [Bacteroidota bacterium]|jgi:hypothetical protein